MTVLAPPKAVLGHKPITDVQHQIAVGADDRWQQEVTFAALAAFRVAHQEAPAATCVSFAPREGAVPSAEGWNPRLAFRCVGEDCCPPTKRRPISAECCRKRRSCVLCGFRPL